MNGYVIGGGARRRNTDQRILAGQPFYGSEELLDAVNRQIDAAASKLVSLHPKRYKNQTGNAKRTILRRISKDNPVGIGGEDLLRWLAGQDWREWK